MSREIHPSHGRLLTRPGTQGQICLACGFYVSAADGAVVPAGTDPCVGEPAPTSAPAPSDPLLLTRVQRVRIEALKLALSTGYAVDPKYLVELASAFEDWINR